MSTLIVFFFCFSAEEMACLATWKEGSSRYFVSMLNHSHVYTDETRYRCFVYQRQHSNELGRVTYKMAQSLYASCLGLWNVNEGHKTFTMTKCKLFLFCFFFWQSVIDNFWWIIGFFRKFIVLPIKSPSMSVYPNFVKKI